MKKFKNAPKWLYLFLLFILIIAINIIFNDNGNNNHQNNEQTKKYFYESNNSYDSDFEYEDIDIAEKAKYEKYINKEAEEKILNQKVFVRIKEFESDSLIDESTATKNIFKAIAIDQENNKWQIQSNYSAELLTKRQNIKIYGLYKGVSSDDNMPIIQMYTSHVDSKYIDKNKIKEIGNNYIDSLNDSYSKEKFVFNKFDESYNAIELLFYNKDKNIEITLSIDIEKHEIDYISVYVRDSSISFTDIDDNLWYSIITTFSPNLSIDEIRTMIVGAEVDALSQTDTDTLYLHGEPILTGYYEYKGYKLGVNLNLKNISIRKKVSN